MSPLLRRFGWLAGLVLVIVLGLGWVLTRPLAVPVLTAQSKVPVILFGLGNVDDERVSRVGFDVGGILAEMRVRVGDHVKAGQVIARLDTSIQSLRVTAASNGLSLAEATARQGGAHVGSAAANVMLKRQIAVRASELQTRNAGTLAAAQDSRADAALAEAQDVESQRAVEVALAAEAQARTGLAQERELLAHYELKAPFDAMVVDRQMVEGAVVQPGQPVATLAAADGMRVLTFINEGQAGSLAPGQPAAITLRSLPNETFAGHVDRIQPSSDATTEERTVAVVFDKPPATLFLQEQAQVRITVGTVDNALLVPERAVRDRENGQGTVWTVENGRLAERRVAIGRRLDDGRLEILTKLPDGVRVAAEEVPKASPGRSARIVEP
jgi:HlyD family secretion protein